MGNVMIDAHGNGLLNDWDHAGGTHNMARGIVSLHSVYAVPHVEVILFSGHVAIHANRTPTKPCQGPRHR